MEKMNLFEMQAIAGGVSREEYCAELDAIMSDNWGSSLKVKRELLQNHLRRIAK